MKRVVSDALPRVETAAELAAIVRDEARLGPGVRAICERVGLGASSVTRFADGSLPVYAIGDAHVLKLYPPLYASEEDTEREVLMALEGHLPLATPRVHAHGEHDGWRFLSMARLGGEPLASAWPRVPGPARRSLAAQLGEALAALHAIEAPASIGPASWSAFVAEQRATSAERQRARGLGPEWCEQIDPFLARTALTHGAPVLLHTEVMREHLLMVERADARWELTGLFDFEPAMRGAREYELASVGIFFSCGEPELLRALLLAYGYDAASLDASLSRRLLAYALLHRYSNVPWYLSRMPAPARPTLEAVAERWWNVAG